MTLITAVLGGLVVGWFFGFTKTALFVLAPVWLVVIVFQTAFVLEDERTPPEDWAYVPVQIAIVAIAFLMVWIGSRLRARFKPSSQTPDAT